MSFLRNPPRREDDRMQIHGRLNKSFSGVLEGREYIRQMKKHTRHTCFHSSSSLSSSSSSSKNKRTKTKDIVHQHHERAKENNKHGEKTTKKDTRLKSIVHSPIGRHALRSLLHVMHWMCHRRRWCLRIILGSTRHHRRGGRSWTVHMTSRRRTHRSGHMTRRRDTISRRWMVRSIDIGCGCAVADWRWLVMRILVGC